jgi:DNA-binding protein
MLLKQKFIKHIFMTKIKSSNLNITTSLKSSHLANLIPNTQNQRRMNNPIGGVPMSKDPNTIYVGTKPAMSYVLAVITHFNESSAKDVTLKARGRAITTAIDVVEIVRRKFLKELKTDKIEIGTEELQREDGTRNVSTIEIRLKR